MIISITYLYWLAGGLLASTSGMILCDRQHPRRWTSALFWGLLAVIFLIGERLPTVLVGVMLIAMSLLAGLGGLSRGTTKRLEEKERRASAQRLGNKLFIPALIIPIGTMLGTVVLNTVKIGGLALLDPKNVALAALGVSCVVAVATACWLTRDTAVQATREAHELTESLGWALVLPQMLAMLGFVFADAGVGKAVAHLTTSYINTDFRLVAVIVYLGGMAIFTIIMGGAFASFPVMTAGVGIPVLVGVYHGNPATVVAIGMFSGYCGTLMTPMAAHFNIVPVALLDLPDKNAVIKAQAPTGLLLLVTNILLLYFLM